MDITLAYFIACCWLKTKADLEINADWGVVVAELK